jgi:hypothetical protein
MVLRDEFHDDRRRQCLMLADARYLLGLVGANMNLGGYAVQ